MQVLMFVGGVKSRIVGRVVRGEEEKWDFMDYGGTEGSLEV